MLVIETTMQGTSQVHINFSLTISLVYDKFSFNLHNLSFKTIILSVEK